jgi:bifunctional DNA-binding transcriptional regulator/antitoxin component of YhaV-PrlF toxin-antitoxin module
MMTELDDATREILNGTSTVSDKIRTLHRAGLPRAEIARMLGKRYQHVRNVLEADKLTTQPRVQAARGLGVEEAAAPYSPGPPVMCRLVVGPRGALTLPDEVMAALGLGVGDVLMGALEDGRLVLTDGVTAARRARERLRAILPPGPSLADELIADRRREAANEDRG